MTAVKYPKGTTGWAQQRWAARKLKAVTVTAYLHRYMCRCGTNEIMKYRGRFYCAGCGRIKKRCAGKMMGKVCDCPLAND